MTNVNYFMLGTFLICALFVTRSEAACGPADGPFCRDDGATTPKPPPTITCYQCANNARCEQAWVTPTLKKEVEVQDSNGNTRSCATLIGPPIPMNETRGNDTVLVYIDNVYRMTITTCSTGTFATSAGEWQYHCCETNDCNDGQFGRPPNETTTIPPTTTTTTKKPAERIASAAFVHLPQVMFILALAALLCG